MPIYMQFEGIAGPVTGRYHGWIELANVQFVSNGGEGVPIVTLDKLSDATSSKLMSAALTKSPRNVKIEFLNGDSFAYLKVDIGAAQISSYSIAGQGKDGSSKPTDSMTINYASIQFTRFAAKAAGATGGGGGARKP